MNIPDEIVANMITQFKNGYSCRKLSEEFGYNRKLISTVLKQNGIQVQHGYSKQQIENAVNLYNEGKSIRYISKTLKMDSNLISLHLQKLGVRTKANPTNPKRQLVENEETKLILSQYLNGNSIKTIADSLKKSTNYVYRVLNHYDIVDSDRLSRKYVMTWQPFHDITTQEQAYWLGLLMADGYVSSEPFRYNVELSLKEKTLVQAFSDFLNTTPSIPIKERTVYTNFAHNGCYQARLLVSDVQLVKDLISWGCTPRKSLTKKFPWKLKQELWRHFIRGYFDGNGHVYYSDKQLYFGFTSSYNMCQAIDYILISEDIVSQRSKLISNGKAYGLRHGGNNQSRAFFNYIYRQATIYMERKYDVFNAVLNESHK